MSEDEAPKVVPEATRLFCIDFERRMKELVDLGGLEGNFGPGHIVFGDYNLEDGNVRWCINVADTDPDFKPGGSCEMDPEDMARHRALLEWVLTVPLEIRCPEGYGCLCSVARTGMDH